MKDYFLRGWKFGAQVVVLFLSSALHELVLICVTKSFTPVFFTLFFTTVFLLDVREPKHFAGHVIFLYVFGLACGVFCCVYTMEFYATFNVNTHKLSSVNYIIPRCLSCLWLLFLRHDLGYITKLYINKIELYYLSVTVPILCILQ